MIYLSVNIPYGFYSPMPEVILNKADVMSQILIREGLKAIGYKESRESFK